MLGAAGLALVTVIGAAWVFRLPLADAAARDVFRKAGVDADFELTDVGLGGAALRNLRLGPENAPDAVAASAAADLRWSLLGPRLAGLRLVEPALRVRIGPEGVSLGQIDGLLEPGKVSGGRPALPNLRIEIVNGRALLLTPAGAIPATFSSQGRLNRDFEGVAEIAPVTRQDATATLADVRGAVRARTLGGVLIVEADGAADAIRTAGFEGANLRFTGNASIPRDIVGGEGRLNVSAQTIAVARSAISGLKLAAVVTPAPDQRWRAQADLDADSVAAPIGGVTSLHASLSGMGDAGQAAGEWSVRSASSRVQGLNAPEATALGAFSYDGRAADGAVIAATGQVTLPSAGLDRDARARALRTIPAMGGSPVAPQIGAGKTALDRALTKFSAAAAVRLDWRGGAGRIAAPGPFVIEAASGGRVTVAPVEPGRPALLVLLPSGGIEGGAHVEMEGGELPPATITLSRFSLAGGKLAAEGSAAIADWRAAGGRIDLQRTTFSLAQDAGAGQLKLDGAVTIDGRTEALSVSNFRAPLRIDAVWGGSFRVALPDRCIPAALDSLGIPGHRFGARAITLCTDADGTLVAADSAGRLSGGFTSDRIAFTGRTDDVAARPVVLSAARIVGRFTGPKSDNHLALEVVQPQYAIDFAPDRRIRFDGAVVTARTAPGGRITGAFRGGVLDDPALPANVDDLAARWSAGPESGRTIVRIADGSANVTDKVLAAEGSAEDEALLSRERFNPLRITGITGALADGRIQANGDILLVSGERPLAAFAASHDLKTGAGKAHVTNDALVFSRDLDLFEISELARGVVDRVQGPVGVDLLVNWNGDGMTSGGRLSPRGVNMNAVSLGPVEGVSGAIDFDDLFALTTPPGQRVTIRKLNPGIVVENGEITFQVRGAEQVFIEGAKWPFSSGELAVAPQLVLIGDDTFSMNLSLRDVDVEQLLRQLNFKDLTATGRVEGSFPLVFTANGGRIENGELRAAPGGGTIRYTGSAGDGLLGAPQIAFDALKSFAYTNLVIGLNGDLDGEIVSEIRFEGENMQPIAGVVPPGALPLPGVERIKVTGWPFKFNVSVRAPFRELARSSDGINDARPLVDQAIRDADVTEPPSPGSSPGTGVDPPRPEPR